MYENTNLECFAPLNKVVRNMWFIQGAKASIIFKYIFLKSIFT